MSASTLTMLQKRQEMARQKKGEIAAASGRRDKPVKPEVGRSTWRILPSWRGADDPDIAHSFGQHFVKDAAGDIKAVHVCLDKTYGKPCPICNALTAAILKSDDEKQKILSESIANGVFILNAVRTDGKGEKDKVVLLSLTAGTFEKILDLADQYADSGVDLFDLEEGFNITITREGAGKKTKYTIAAAPKSTAINPSVLDDLNNLDTYVAQQNSESQTLALATLNVVSGYLAGPKSSTSMDDEDVGFFEKEAGDDIDDGEFEEVETPKVKAAAKAAPKAAAKKPEPKTVSDEEIDDLLGDLGDFDLEDL